MLFTLSAMILVSKDSPILDQKTYFNPKKNVPHFIEVFTFRSKIGQKALSPHNFYIFLVFSKILKS